MASFENCSTPLVTACVRTMIEPPGDFAWAWALERSASKPLHVSVVPALPTGPRASPNEDELILWFGAPDGDGRDLFGHLSADERARATSFRFEADRWSFAAAHGGLRVLLASMLDCAPQALRFASAPRGKPHLDGGGPRAGALQFSMSHARGCVAVAVARCAVGVDVERRRTMNDMMAVAKTAFAPEEFAALTGRLEPSVRSALFFRYWTLGEAFIKATGDGLAEDLSSFAFNDADPPELMRVSALRGPPNRWRFHCGP